MDLEPIRKTIWSTIRVLYPGCLAVALWSQRDAATFDSISLKKIASADLLPLSVTAFIVGCIVYTACRALIFELLLNRFFRDVLWSATPDRSWKFLDKLLGKQNETEITALVHRLHDDKSAVRDFLDMRFGWVNVQIQTATLVVVFFWFVASPFSVWRSSPCWILAVAVLLLFYVLGTVRQCRTLWCIEQQLVKNNR
jgi:hypothetical protein